MKALCKSLTTIFFNINYRFGYHISSSVPKMGIFTQTLNPITGDSEWNVQHDDYDYHQEIARSSFADMLHDTERNQKYYLALKAAIEKMHSMGKKANVLDIGTGTGLLSIMAANCGADTITACEAFKPMAECALNVIAENKVADRIKLIAKRSTDITVGENCDMESRANVLVTEVFDTELIGEGALETFSHAHRVLLEKDCIVIPHSGVIYAQVIECPTMQKWNKLNDLANEDGEIVLKTPNDIKKCPGSAAVHDIQLSQLPINAFHTLTEPIPVLHYDWSGNKPIEKNQNIKHLVKCTRTGKAQMVFMWWDLNMDTEGKVLLSCAPWWQHSDADLSIEYPQESIPWRDHWMQAVYYFPNELIIEKNEEVNLQSCQDEYSLWFYLDKNTDSAFDEYERPVCSCGVHMTFSRTQVSYLNDGKRNKKFLNVLSESVNKDTVVLCLNGSSLLGLVASKLGAKLVYYVETNNVIINVLKDFIQHNQVDNIKFVPSAQACPLESVNLVIGDPNFSNAILPWDNLKYAYILHQIKTKLSSGADLLPSSCTVWAMPVEFLDLQKIRIPLGVCEGVDMKVFDNLIDDSRSISDDELEAQPLWEYPCMSRGHPVPVLNIDFTNLIPLIESAGSHEIRNHSVTYNGFAVWMTWNLTKDGKNNISNGPLIEPQINERVNWDPHTRQAVKILSKTCTITDEYQLSYKTVCNLESGNFSLDINLTKSSK